MKLPIANIDGVIVNLHWTDKPYIWHINDGQEVFTVLSGIVDMHYKQDSQVKTANLKEGDIFYASVGTEHVAHPQGEARILVVEKEGAV